MQQSLKLTALLSFLVTTLPVSAEVHLSEEAFFSDLPVVLHATRLNQPVSETPASITVIDQAMIRSSTANTIPELLRFVPGFQVAYASGNEATVAYHGVADQHARRMQVLVDGRSIYNQAFGGVLWDTLSLSIEDIEKIEVIRGPNAAAYGANSFFGVINIITKSPAEYQGTTVRADYGEDDLVRTYLRHAGNQGKLNYSLSAQYEENDGFDERNDSVVASHFNFKGVAQLNATDILDFSMGYRDADELRGFAGDIVQPLRERHFDTHYQTLRWKRVNAVNDETQISFYHDYLDSRDAFYPILASDYFSFLLGASVDPLFIPLMTGHADGLIGINQDFTAHRYDLEFQRIQSVGETTRIVWGAGFRNDVLEADIIDDGRVSRDQWRLFANVEWQLSPAMLVNVGAMVEDHEDIGDFVSPRIGINYKLDETHSLRASASRAYRMPSIFEYDAELGIAWEDGAGVVDIDLPVDLPPAILYDSLEPRPEQIDAYEIGYIGQYMGGRLSTDIKLFYNKITDLIDSEILDPARPDTFLYINSFDITHKGLEAQFQYLDEKNRFLLGYSYVDSEEHGQTWRSSTPKHTLSAHYARNLTDSLVASLSGFYVDEMRWRGEGDVVDSSSWFDFKLQKRIKSSGGEASLALTIHNLFDQELYSFRDENLDERRFLISFKYNF